MAGNAFVIRDRLDVQQEAMLRIVFIDVDVTRTRAIGGAGSVVGWYGILLARRSHWNGDQLRLWQMAKIFGEFRLHLTDVLCVKIEQLLAGGRVELAVIFDVLVETAQVVEPEFLG